MISRMYAEQIDVYVAFECRKPYSGDGMHEIETAPEHFAIS